jgi:hypothetical protein
MVLLLGPILSLDGEGRMTEAGRGNDDVGFGMPDCGRGSRERRGMAVDFCGVSSMIEFSNEAIGMDLYCPGLTRALPPLRELKRGVEGNK